MMIPKNTILLSLLVLLGCSSPIKRIIDRKILSDGDQALFELPEETTLGVRYKSFISNYLILSYSFQEFDGSGSRVSLVDSKTNKRIWLKEFVKLNPTKTVIRQDRDTGESHIYIGFYDSIYKLSLKTGDVIWKKEDLYKAYNYQALQTPKISGDYILFSPHLKLNLLTQKLEEHTDDD